MQLKNLKLVFSLRCEEASQLISDSLDRDLTAVERWALRVHTLACRPCRRLLRQLQTMRELVSKIPDALRDTSRISVTRLSAERRRRIKQLLREAQQQESS